MASVALALGQERLQESPAGDEVRIPYNYRSRSSYSSDDVKLRVPRPPAGLKMTHIQPMLEEKDPQTRAFAIYFAILLGNDLPMTPIIDEWSRDKKNESVAMLVVDLVSVRDEDQFVPLLSEIFDLLGGPQETTFSSKLYWTIRSMRGPAALKLRQRIRDAVGMNRLN